MLASPALSSACSRAPQGILCLPGRNRPEVLLLFLSQAVTVGDSLPLDPPLFHGYFSSVCKRGPARCGGEWWQGCVADRATVVSSHSTQARDDILNGSHPVSFDKACEFAGYQCQIQFGPHNEQKHKPGFLE